MWLKMSFFLQNLAKNLQLLGVEPPDPWCFRRQGALPQIPGLRRPEASLPDSRISLLPLKILGFASDDFVSSSWWKHFGLVSLMQLLHFVLKPSQSREIHLIYSTPQSFWKCWNYQLAIISDRHRFRIISNHWKRRCLWIINNFSIFIEQYMHLCVLWLEKKWN